MKIKNTLENVGGGGRNLVLTTFLTSFLVSVGGVTHD